MQKPKRKAKSKNSQTQPLVWLALMIVILVGLGGIGFIIYYQLKTPLATQIRDPLSVEAVRPHILAEANINRNAEIIRLQAGGSFINLSNHPANDVSPHASSDGSRIVFLSDRDTDEIQWYDIYVMNVDGSNPVNLTHTPDISEAGAVFSPDDTQIVFTAGTIAWEQDLYLMNSDGTNYHQIELEFETAFSPSWSPDGSQIAFSGVKDGFMGLWIANVDGTNLHQIADGQLPVEDVAWSPLGNEIAFTSRKPNVYPEVVDIYLINTDGSNLRNFTDSPEADWMPSWTADGRLLFLSRQGGADDQIFCDCFIRDANAAPTFLQISEGIFLVKHPVWIE